MPDTRPTRGGVIHTDSRNRIEKMLAMAEQDEAPSDRDIAREMLASMGHWPPPPKPPAPPVLGDDDEWRGQPPTGVAWTHTSSSTAGSNFYVNGQPLQPRRSNQ